MKCPDCNVKLVKKKLVDGYKKCPLCWQQFKVKDEDRVAEEDDHA